MVERKSLLVQADGPENDEFANIHRILAFFKPSVT